MDIKVLNICTLITQETNRLHQLLLHWSLIAHLLHPFIKVILITMLAVINIQCYFMAINITLV